MTSLILFPSAAVATAATTHHFPFAVSSDFSLSALTPSSDVTSVPITTPPGTTTTIDFCIPLIAPPSTVDEALEQIAETAPDETAQLGLITAIPCGVSATTTTSFIVESHRSECNVDFIRAVHQQPWLSPPRAKQIDFVPSLFDPNSILIILPIGEDALIVAQRGSTILNIYSAHTYEYIATWDFECEEESSEEDDDEDHQIVVNRIEEAVISKDGQTLVLGFAQANDAIFIANVRFDDRVQKVQITPRIQIPSVAIHYENQQTQRFCLSPDDRGSLIFTFLDNFNVAIHDTTTGVAVACLHLGTQEAPISVHLENFRWSPDCTRIALLHRRDALEPHWTLTIWKFGGAAPTTRDLAWFPYTRDFLWIDDDSILTLHYHIPQRSLILNYTIGFHSDETTTSVIHAFEPAFSDHRIDQFCFFPYSSVNTRNIILRSPARSNEFVVIDTITRSVRPIVALGSLLPSASCAINWVACSPSGSGKFWVRSFCDRDRVHSAECANRQSIHELNFAS
jgi:hypothetical protein